MYTEEHHRGKKGGIRRVFQQFLYSVKSFWGTEKTRGPLVQRLFVFRIVLTFSMFAILVRLFYVQVIEHHFYSVLASSQQEIYRQLFPKRGSIFVRDRDGTLFPVATNRVLTLVWADLRKMEDPAHVAHVLASALNLDETELRAKIEPRNDPYLVIAHNVSDEIVDSLRTQNLSGIAFFPESSRIYPEISFGGQTLGFVGSGQSGQLIGRYGLEGYYEDLLRGQHGFLDAKRDPGGRLIPVASSSGKPAQDGSNLVLTIDRTIQYYACSHLAAAVQKHGAAGGSVVITDPKTGAVLAMCGYPDFDSNNYRSVSDISVFNNPAVWDAYEPGSIFKAITMAAGIDVGAISPDSTYTDTGDVQIGSFHIRNFDFKAHGLQTMTYVLDQSLNTGAIFVMRAMGTKSFQNYVSRFGFGAETGIDVKGEGTGNVNSLNERGEIYPATASFGQGISVTPIQIAAAFGALANDGKLYRPYVVAETQYPDGEVIATTPLLRRQVISAHTATLIDAMLVSVVELGEGKRAGVPGYYMAGKTGTAQIPRMDGGGYEVGPTIGTFAGFGPVEDPKFVMVVRINRPTDVKFAESSAAPLFGDIAKFLTQYYQIPPTRSVK